MPKEKSKSLHLLTISILIIFFFLFLNKTIKHPNIGGAAVAKPLQDDFVENEVLVWLPKANSTYLCNGWHIKIPEFWVSINSDNFRGLEFRTEKAKGIMRIALLGDSYAFGWGLNHSDTFLQVAGKKLEKQGYNLETLNFGVPGYDTIQEAELLRTKVMKYDPDLLVIQYHESDIIPTALLIKETEEKTNNAFLKILLNYRRFRATFESKIMDEISAEILKNTEEEIYQKISEPFLTIRNTFKKEIIILNWIEPWGEHEKKLSKVINKVCKEQNMTYINVYGEIMDISQITNLSLKISEQDTHPNKEAHKIVGLYLADYLANNNFLEISKNDYNRITFSLKGRSDLG